MELSLNEFLKVNKIPELSPIVFAETCWEAGIYSQARGRILREKAPKPHLIYYGATSRNTREGWYMGKIALMTYVLKAGL